MKNLFTSNVTLSSSTATFETPHLSYPHTGLRILYQQVSLTVALVYHTTVFKFVMVGTDVKILRTNMGTDPKEESRTLIVCLHVMKPPRDLVLPSPKQPPSTAGQAK